MPQALLSGPRRKCKAGTGAPGANPACGGGGLGVAAPLPEAKAIPTAAKAARADRTRMKRRGANADMRER